MKKLAVIFMLLFMFLLTGCGKKNDSQERTDSQNSQETNAFVCIQKSDYDHPYDIVYQRDTKVMYAVSKGAYNQGILTLLVNPDGTPMLYEEESEEEE